MQDNHSSLSSNSIKILTDANQSLYVSIASFWEIAIKQSLGKLNLSYSLQELHEACVKSDIEILPILMSELDILKDLPFIHRDPFDRLIISTAISYNFVLISKDEQLKKYPLEVIW
ncbi:type II toxin-antitoxin system VapC family toxin [Pedobacter aquae]|uniref:Type II toxin-antitoxin system VapC family toxin n=2 Tax=Pedobacter aquae TaxID=2605747 RepID=A0A5C0VMA2_9SPHI|nr:type II toxin-antitoxin system VapC family toxin [Pedobacter aquae]